MNHSVVFDLRGIQAVASDQGPLSSVCGLPVLVRNVLVLERHDYRRGVLLLDADQRSAVERCLKAHPRVTMDLSLIEPQGPGLAEALAAVDDSAALLHWPADLSFGRFAPQWVGEDPPSGGALCDDLKDPDAALCLFAVDLVRQSPDASAADLVNKAKENNKLKEMPLEHRPIRVSSTVDLKVAKKALLDSLRKPEDGVVAQYDRNISLFISSRLMPLAIHPHWVTIAAGLVGVACGVIAAQGGYFALLLGALLFQANSIMDGIDGEIARAKLLESPSGQWLDTIADDSCNLFFTVGAAIGCYHTWGSPLYLVLAGIIGFGFSITAAMEYHYLITVAKSGDLNQFKMPWEEGDQAHSREPTGPVARLLQKLKFVVRRDTFVFLTTLFAIVGQVRIMIWFFALGASVVWVSILAYRWILPLASRKKQAA